MELSFKKYLETQQRDTRRKGDRTRVRLRIAAIEVLDKVGYHRMRITDIAAAAGISPASLYQYYSDKLEITLAVLDEFDHFFSAKQNALDETEAPRSHFEAIQRSNLRFLELVQSNAGIMRCLLQVADDEPEFAERFYKTSRAQNQRIAAGLAKRLQVPSQRVQGITLVVYVLGAMMDEMARRLLVQRDPHLREVMDAMDIDTPAFASVLSGIWYRALYAADSVESEAALAPALSPLRRARRVVRTEIRTSRRPTRKATRTR